MKCAKCGNALDDGALFCGQCGAVVGVSYAPPSGTAGFSDPAHVAAPSPVLPPPPSAVSNVPRSAAQVTSLAGRVKAILATPRTEWSVVADEATPPATIYLGYVAPLAAIGAIALFIAQVVIGTAIPLLGLVRASIAAGIVAATLTFALALISVYALARIIDMLAPQFGGQRDSLRALKVSAYSYTPVWLAGVLQIVPAWDIVALAASLYGLYLLYVGLPVLMGCPPRQAGPYAGMVVACAVVLYLLFGGLTACVAGFGPGIFS